MVQLESIHSQSLLSGETTESRNLQIYAPADVDSAVPARRESGDLHHNSQTGKPSNQTPN